MKVSIRKKGKNADGTPKFILERYEEGKVVETRTLLRPRMLWDLHRPGKSDENTSNIINQKDENTNENFF